MSMFNDIDWTKREEIQKDVFQIPKKLRLTLKNFREDTGHSSALETKRSGGTLICTLERKIGFHRLTDGGTIQRNKFIQCSRASVL